MRLLKLFLLFILSITTLVTFAQSGYSIIQAGGNIGIANKGYTGSFGGFAAHFIFGRNYNEIAYLGLGLGNEIFKGDYLVNDLAGKDVKMMKYDYSLMPIFFDGRLPIKQFGFKSSVGALANAGYAPKVGQRYDKGFLFKGGLYYLLDNPGYVDFFVSAVYGYQQLTKNTYGKNFNHQHLGLSVCIMFK